MVAAKPALAAVVVAVATFAASVVMAQTENGTLWLECDQTAEVRSDWFNLPLGYMAISNNSVVHYTRDSREPGGIKRWNDLCEFDGAICTVNADEIRAVFRFPYDLDYIYTVTINRSSGRYRREDTPTRLYKNGVRVQPGYVEGQCRRTADPRPPAAF